MAQEREFRRAFENFPDIGGRYSALSFFGLVPAAVMGLDVGMLLDRALAMRTRCSADSERNPGLALGTAMSREHAAGHDKVTIVTPPRFSAFSLWAEQLIAEFHRQGGQGLHPDRRRVPGPA